MINKPFDEWTLQDELDAIDAFTKPIPFPFGGKLNHELKEVAKADRDKNGKADSLEWLAKLGRAQKLMTVLNEQVDFEKAEVWVETLPFIKDHAVVKATLREIAAEIEHAQKLADAQKLLESQNKN